MTTKKAGSSTAGRSVLDSGRIAYHPCPGVAIRAILSLRKSIPRGLSNISLSLALGPE